MAPWEDSEGRSFMARWWNERFRVFWEMMMMMELEACNARFGKTASCWILLWWDDSMCACVCVSVWRKNELWKTRWWTMLIRSLFHARIQSVPSRLRPFQSWATPCLVVFDLAKSRWHCDLLNLLSYDFFIKIVIGHCDYANLTINSNKKDIDVYARS